MAHKRSIPVLPGQMVAPVRACPRAADARRCACEVVSSTAPAVTILAMGADVSAPPPPPILTTGPATTALVTSTNSVTPNIITTSERVITIVNPRQHSPPSAHPSPATPTP